jgi:hypothetical protein
MLSIVYYSLITGLGAAVIAMTYINLETNPILTISQGFDVIGLYSSYRPASDIFWDLDNPHM